MQDYDTLAPMKCVIIASGDLDYTEQMIRLIKNAHLIICADGGAEHLKQMGILPHVLIGDFDSIAPEDKAFLIENQVKILSFPPEKDKTDSALCIDYALDQKATDITLLGVTGTRMDHTLANIFLLKQMSQSNIPARIINAFNEIHLVTTSISLKGQPGDFLSLIPASEKVTGITLEGLVYPLKNASIEMGSSLGISNCFKDKTAKVTIENGILIVTKSRDAAE